MAQRHRPVPGEQHENNYQGSQSVRPHVDSAPHLRRELIRARTRRASRPVAEPDEVPERGYMRASMASWAILALGLAVAVGGVVQAALRGDGEVASVSDQSLERQVSDLRVELDKERAENTQLLAKVASTPESVGQFEAQAPLQPEAQAETQVETQIETQAETQIEETPAPVEPPLEVQSAAVQPVSTAVDVQPDVQATSDDNTLPPPMAPSAELLNQEIAGIEPSGQKANTYGIHLATFSDRSMAERGWVLLQRNHPGGLGALKPRIDELKDQTGRPVFLLIAGPFESEAAAASHCQKIGGQVVFCKARAFTGSEFAANRQ